MIDNLEQAAQFDRDEAFVRDKLGALKLARMMPGQDTSDLSVAAVNTLLRDAPGLDAGAIDAMVVVSQNPDNGGLPHISALTQSKVGLPDTVACFDVGLGCSGYVYGLYVLKGFLEATGGHNGVLVTADPYSKILNRNDPNTSMLFGDAATATWIGSEPRWALGSSLFQTDGGSAGCLRKNGAILEMNGRKVFNFAMFQVPKQIDTLMEQANLSIDDVDRFYLHQGSAIIVNTIRRRLKLSEKKVPLALEGTGNTVSSSIPLAMVADWQHDRSSCVVLSGFGVGLSWASCVLHRQNMTD